jgi:SAM-dependent methyltransferase
MTVDRHSLLHAPVWQAMHQRQRAMLSLFARLGWEDLPARRVLEIGCGTGGTLLELLQLGFSARNLCGIEVSAERYAKAIQRLPAGVILIQGDVLKADLPTESEDIVMQSEVFSRLLDAPFQWQLAQAMWRWVRPGGGVLWYDSTAGADRPDGRGVPMRRVRELFPHGRMIVRRIGLPEPLARAACALSPALYPLLGAIPGLRTHALAWIEKSRGDDSKRGQAL